MAAADRLRQFSIVHLATHATIDCRSFLQSALLLAADSSDDRARRPLCGEALHDGRLTVVQIRQTWKLDADLVVLSACQSGLGQQNQGEGYLGFAQALFLAGERSLVLTSWPVDDASTATTDEAILRKPTGPACGARCAFVQVRGFKRGQALAPRLTRDQVDAALDGPARGTERRKHTRSATTAAHPFEHPYFWAGFMLIGDPD